MIHLSKRLQTLHDLLLPGEPAWDLCCDHGLLGLKALESGLFPRVHFVDQVPHIMQRLQGILDENPHRGHAQCHTLPAENLAEPLTGSVVIAGVGGERILGMVKALTDRQMLRASRLILGPHKDEKTFVEDFKKLFEGRWEVVSHHPVVEGPRTRQIWVAAPVL